MNGEIRGAYERLKAAVESRSIEPIERARLIKVNGDALKKACDELQFKAMRDLWEALPGSNVITFDDVMDDLERKGFANDTAKKVG